MIQRLGHMLILGVLTVATNPPTAGSEPPALASGHPRPQDPKATERTDKVGAKDSYHDGKTGWKLGKYHARVACAACHTTPGTFTGLKRDCASCHGVWGPGTFDHKKTGLELDESHVGHACKDCHTTQTYGDPKCGSCHEEKITYPKYKPGVLVK